MTVMLESIESAPNYAPPIEDAVDPDRRLLIKLALGAVGARYMYDAAALVDTMGRAIGHDEDEIWPHDKPSFNWINPETLAEQHEFTLYVPGLGQDAKQKAETWFQTSNLANMPTAFMNYSHRGTTIETLAGLIKADPFVKDRMANDPSFLIHVVGCSLGGLYSFPLLAELGMQVGTLVCISSPGDINQGDFGRLGSALADLPKWRAVDLLTKTMVNAYRNYKEHGFNPPRNLDGGWNAAMHGEDPVGLQQEVRTGKHINILDEKLLTRLSNGIMVPGVTKMVYTSSYRPASDITVHVQSSGNRYETAARRLHVDFDWSRIHYEGHADVYETARALQDWIEASTSPDRTFLASK